MIRLPDLQPTQINNPQMDARAAAAPAVALGNVANAIAGVGEHFHGVAVETQKRENAMKVSELRLGLDQEYSTLQNELEKEPDGAKRMERMQQFLSASKGRFESDDLPPDVRDKMKLYHDEFAGNAMIRQASDTARLTQRRAVLQLQNELTAAEDAGDPHRMELAIRTAEDGGVILPEEAARVRYQAGQKLQDRQERTTIMEDPAGWLRANPLGKVPEGTDPLTHARQRDFAQGQLREMTYQDTSDIQDGIASGGITTPEQIEKMAGHLRPAAVEELKGVLARQAVLGRKEKLASPEYQNGVIGEVSAMLRDYNASDDETFDRDFVRMDELVRSLPEGTAVRVELERQIKSIRSGTWAEVKTHADAAFKALDDYDKQLGEKLPPVTKIPLKKFIADGFLKDQRKLEQDLGFSKSQAKDIVKLALKDPAQAQMKFKETWAKRPEGSIHASPEDIAIADSLRSENGYSTFDDPESVTAAARAKQDHYQQSGERRAKLADFLKLNPKATPAEIDEKILGIAGEQTTRNLRSGLYDAKPTRSQTSSVDIKLSNYGYLSDTTPDSNSTRGIGHANNKLEDGKSAAISKSLADRLNLKPGDEVELETTKGKFRVRYDDTVPATDDRTGDLPETIDIYRKKDGANNWGGKVTKITKVS